MTSFTTRRKFVKGMFVLGGLAAGHAALPCLARTSSEEEVDPATLSYCGLSCTDKCKLFRATRDNDIALKKEVARDWYNIEEKDFDPDRIFCYGCKSTREPESPSLAKCTVRKCASEKGMATCADCRELKTCDKDLWKSYPKMREKLLERRS
jgi:hypothetical protein